MALILLAVPSDEKCIRIHAAGNIEVVAGNDITIKAKKNIAIEAGENISMQSGKDTDISADANVSIEAENNMQQGATDIFVKAENSISQESGNSHIIKTEKLQEKAGGTATPERLHIYHRYMVCNVSLILVAQ